MRLWRRSPVLPLAATLLLLSLSWTVVHDVDAQRPLSFSDLMDTMLEGTGALRGTFGGRNRFSLGHGAHFSRAKNGDMLATVPLPALASGDGEEGSGEEGARHEQRSVAATILRGGMGLRVEASVHAYGGSIRSRAIFTLSLPERASAVRSAGFVKGGDAEIVLVPAPGQEAAHLPPAPANAGGTGNWQAIGHEGASGSGSMRATGRTEDAGVVIVGEGAGAWRVGGVVVLVAFVALALFSRRRSLGAASKGAVGPGETANLTQVLSQRGTGGRDKDDVVIFEARQKGSGKREKSNEKVS